MIKFLVGLIIKTTNFIEAKQREIQGIKSRKIIDKYIQLMVR